ncbi:hypothetical protein Hanom_Chr17g01584151 [Helianthus anomalus]
MFFRARTGYINSKGRLHEKENEPQILIDKDNFTSQNSTNVNIPNLSDSHLRKSNCYQVERVQ